MKNITLIEPKPPGKHVFSSVNMPRLGLPILGTQLKELGYNVTILYGAGGDIKVSDLRGSDLVGISTTTSTCKEAYHIARYARAMQIPVVMGGSHVTFMADEALDHCDYVCRGEADNTFIDLLKCIESGQEPAIVPGVSYWRDNEKMHNAKPDFIDVNETPIPDFSLFKNMNQLSTFPVMTSRGCPFDCTFCSVTAMFGRKYRWRDQESVLEELKKFTGKKVFFCDDNFTANPRRTKELLRSMLQRKILPSSWGAQVRTDAARDEELLGLMKQAGCSVVYVGMESVNPKTLETYNKKQGVEDIEYCINKFHEHKIMVHGMFVFGSDDDTKETIDQSLAFALRTKIDTVQFLVLTPFPGTPLYDQLESEGRILTHDWNFYDGHHVVFQPKLMSALELQTESVRAFKDFYAAKNLANNLFLTGSKSVAYKAVGWHLTRWWEKHNDWYYSFLGEGQGQTAKQTPALAFYKRIESIKLKNLKYLSLENMMDITIFQQNGAFMIELKGYMNKFALKEIFAAVKQNIPKQYNDLVINIGQLNFDSEAIARKFVKDLNKLAMKARSVKVNAAYDGSVLQQILEKYNGSIPHFEL
ncbi:MAG: B12-binding domain-containing radical SAM protein [Acidobacteriota bacterium]